jgi:hypothetical protein
MKKIPPFNLAICPAWIDPDQCNLIRHRADEVVSEWSERSEWSGWLSPQSIKGRGAVDQGTTRMEDQRTVVKRQKMLLDEGEALIEGVVQKSEEALVRTAEFLVEEFRQELQRETTRLLVAEKVQLQRDIFYKRQTTERHENLLEKERKKIKLTKDDQYQLKEFAMRADWSHLSAKALISPTNAPAHKTLLSSIQRFIFKEKQRGDDFKVPVQVPEVPE